MRKRLRGNGCENERPSKRGCPNKNSTSVKNNNIICIPPFAGFTSGAYPTFSLPSVNVQTHKATPRPLNLQPTKVTPTTSNISVSTFAEPRKIPQVVRPIVKYKVPHASSYKVPQTIRNVFSLPRSNMMPVSTPADSSSRIIVVPAGIPTNVKYNMLKDPTVTSNSDISAKAAVSPVNLSTKSVEEKKSPVFVREADEDDVDITPRVVEEDDEDEITPRAVEEEEEEEEVEELPPPPPVPRDNTSSTSSQRVALTQDNPPNGAVEPLDEDVASAAAVAAAADSGAVPPPLPSQNISSSGVSFGEEDLKNARGKLRHVDETNIKVKNEDNSLLGTLKNAFAEKFRNANPDNQPPRSEVEDEEW